MKAIEDLEQVEIIAILGSIALGVYLFFKYIYCPYISTDACGKANAVDPSGTNTGLGSGITVGNGPTACTGLGCTGALIGNYWNQFTSMF